MKKFSGFEPIDLKNIHRQNEIIEINLINIVPDNKQARKNFNEQAINELAESIAEHGVIQPVIVKKIDNTGNFQLIAGERRWRAAKIAGLKTVPVIIRNYNEASQSAVSLIENIQRENLNSLEEAQAIKNLIEDHHMTHHQVAKSLGKSRTSVSNLLRLLDIAEPIKPLIMNGQLEMGHARALLSLPEKQQVIAAQNILDHSLSVRDTEKFVKNLSISTINNNIDDTISGHDSDKISLWKNEFESRIGMKVNLNLNDQGSGKLVIQFSSLEEINWLMGAIKISY